MRSTHNRRPGEGGQGGGVPGGGLVVFLRRPGSGLGAQRARAADDWPHRGGGQGLGQAGGRGGDPA
jgi:hypothetical protein